MTELLNSIKDDLLDRRLMPIVALVGACLVAALAYAVLGGGSSSPSQSSASTSGTPVTSGGLAVSQTTPETAVAETTDGFKEQHTGKARDPFLALPGAAAAAAAAAKSAAKSSSSSSSATTKSGGTSSGGSSTTTGSTKTETKKKTTPKPAYDVAIEFGVLPAGTTPETASLTPYADLKLQTPLPSASHALLVFRGVTVKGASATFTLVGEAILHGVGACLPDAAKCQAIDLKPGDTEQLEYLQPNGETVVYELKVVSIAKAAASTASVKPGWAESKAGSELLRHSGLEGVPFLRYSSLPGVLVFAQHGAFSSRAHTSQH